MSKEEEEQMVMGELSTGARSGSDVPAGGEEGGPPARPVAKTVLGETAAKAQSRVRVCTYNQPAHPLGFPYWELWPIFNPS